MDIVTATKAASAAAADTTTTLSFASIVVLALTSGIVTTALTILVDWIKSSRAERRSLERDARYLAIRLATMLEKFAIDCADIVGRNSSGDMKYAHSLPVLPPFPGDAEWKALDPGLSAEVLSLPNEVSIGDLTASEIGEITGDQDDAADAVAEHAGKCGFRALTLATRLREKYDLPRPDFGPKLWDFEEQLKKRHDAFAKRAAASNEPLDP